MSDRTDRKLQQVAVGRYGYRHEAEFAAGFLDDAGIPYRLQVDDPVLGFSLSASPATIWVLGADERRARAVLEHDLPEIEAGASDRVERGDEADEMAGDGRAGVAPGVGSARDSSDTVSAAVVPNRSSALGAPDRASGLLGIRERILALVSGSALGGLTGVVDLAGVTGATLVVAALLVVIGVAGRAPAPVKRILAALSGESP